MLQEEEGFSSCFQLLHLWLAVQMGGQLVMLYASHVPRICGPSVTLQSQLSLVTPPYVPHPLNVGTTYTF